MSTTTKKPRKPPRQTFDFRSGHSNPGQRPVAQISEFMIAALKGEKKFGLDGQPIDVIGLNEIRDRLPGLRTRIEKAGLGFIEGPDEVADGRKQAFAFNPELSEPKGELRWEKTADAFDGRRPKQGDKKVRMGNRIVLAQEFTHLASGRTPWVVEGHVVPSLQLKLQAEGAIPDMENTAKLLRELKGAVVCYKDWNGEWDDTPRSVKDLFDPIRALQDGRYAYTITSKEYPNSGTFGHGPRTIDWGLVRQLPGFTLTGEQRFWLPGVEKGSHRGHALMVANIRAKQLQEWTPRGVRA